MRAKLIGEKSAGMTAVEIYDDETLVWSHRYFDDGATHNGYIMGLLQVMEDMTGCGDVSQYEGGDQDEAGNPVQYSAGDTTGIICEYDSRAGCWMPGDYTLGQSCEIPAALMLSNALATDDDLLEQMSGRVLDDLKKAVIG